MKQLLSTSHLLLSCLAGDYFPKAHDDSISVWEDESISFSVLENDYFAGENATVIGFSTVCLYLNELLVLSALSNMWLSFRLSFLQV